MKGYIIRTIFTTGSAIIILALFNVIIGKNDIEANTILEILAANILINLGLTLRHKIEIRSIILEFIIDVGYIVAVLAVSGLIFDWFSVISIWLLVFMAAAIYTLVVITILAKTRKVTEEINALLQKRKEKETSIAP